MAVIVVATAFPIPEHCKEVAAAFEAAIGKVHAEEDGCELYALNEGPDGRLVMIENYASHEAVAAHRAGAGLAALRPGSCLPHRRAGAHTAPGGSSAKGARLRRAHRRRRADARRLPDLLAGQRARVPPGAAPLQITTAKIGGNWVVFPLLVLTLFLAVWHATGHPLLSAVSAPAAHSM